MLISTEYNYIYLSIVTEIDKFMLNLVNLSITSSAEFNNYLFFFFFFCHTAWKKKGSGGEKGERGRRKDGERQ